MFMQETGLKCIRFHSFTNFFKGFDWERYNYEGLAYDRDKTIKGISVENQITK